MAAPAPALNLHTCALPMPAYRDLPARYAFPAPSSAMSFAHRPPSSGSPGHAPRPDSHSVRPSPAAYLQTTSHVLVGVPQSFPQATTFPEASTAMATGNAPGASVP